MAAFFLLALGIELQERKDKEIRYKGLLDYTLHKAFKIRLRLFLEDFVECVPCPLVPFYSLHPLRYPFRGVIVGVAILCLIGS